MRSISTGACSGLGPLCWAACGKDPGFTPLSLLELLRRRGRVRTEDLARLDLAAPVDLHAMKQEWIAALATGAREESSMNSIQLRSDEHVLLHQEGA